MPDGLSLEVQMYRNVGPYYCNSGFSLEVGLSLQWSIIAGFTVRHFNHPRLKVYLNTSAWSDLSNFDGLVNIAFIDIFNK